MYSQQQPQQKMTETCQHCKVLCSISAKKVNCAHMICQKCSLAPIGNGFATFCPICNNNRGIKKQRLRNFSSSSSSSMSSSSLSYLAASPTPQFMMSNLKLDQDSGFIDFQTISPDSRTSINSSILNYNLSPNNCSSSVGYLNNPPVVQTSRFHSQSYMPSSSAPSTCMPCKYSSISNAQSLSTPSQVYQSPTYYSQLNQTQIAYVHNPLDKLKTLDIDTCIQSEACLNDLHSLDILIGDLVDTKSKLTNVINLFEENMKNAETKKNIFDSNFSKLRATFIRHVNIFFNDLEKDSKDIYLKKQLYNRNKVECLTEEIEKIENMIKDLKIHNLSKMNDFRQFINKKCRDVEKISKMQYTAENLDLHLIHKLRDIAARLPTFGKIVTDSFPGKCKLEGVNMESAFGEKPSSVSLVCYDIIGRKNTTGGEDVTAYIITESLEEKSEISRLLNVSDTKDGKYRIHFNLSSSKKVTQTIRVFMRKREVSGSPFKPIIKTPQHYSEIKDKNIVFGNENISGKTIDKPWGIHCDRDGYIYVSDRFQHCVHVFNPDHTLHHRFGSAGSSQGFFCRPAGITVDKNRRVIVVDKDNHRIQIFSFEGELILCFGKHGTGNCEFKYPWGVDTNDDGVIAVSDTRNKRIQLFDKIGQFLTVFGNTGQNPLDNPRGVKFGQWNRLYVTDFDSHQVLIFEGYMTDRNREQANVKCHVIVGNFTTLKNVYLESEFRKKESLKNMVYDINMAVPYNYGQKKFQRQKNFVELPDDLKRQVTLWRPQGITFDCCGNLMVTSQDHHRIQIYTPNGLLINQLNLAKYYNYPTGVVDKEKPVDITVSPTGTIYLAILEKTETQLVHSMVKEIKQ